MKTKIIPAILACSAILASANMVPASTQTPAVAPAPLHPYPAYPQQAMPPQDYFNGLPKNINSQIKIYIQVLLLLMWIGKSMVMRLSSIILWSFILIAMAIFWDKNLMINHF